MKTKKRFSTYSLKADKIKKNKKAKGFTLVELIVVIAIIGVLAIVLVPNMMSYVKKSRLSTANDAAAKIYDQANLIAAELEMEGKTVKGTYSTDINLSGEAYDIEFSAALSKAVPDLGENDDLTIIFDSSGQVSCVVYHEDGSDYAGAHPDAVTMDEYEDSDDGDALYSTIVSDRDDGGEDDDEGE